jgi:hypothetical protein
MNATLHPVLALCTVAVPSLARARWVWRSPRTGILLWQMVLPTWVPCASGALLAVGLAPFGTDIPPALGRWLGGDGLPAGSTLVLVVGLVLALGLVGVVGWSWVRVASLRRRHRDALVVARQDDGLPGRSRMRCAASPTARHRVHWPLWTVR